MNTTRHQSNEITKPSVCGEEHMPEYPNDDICPKCLEHSYPKEENKKLELCEKE